MTHASVPGPTWRTPRRSQDNAACVDIAPLANGDVLIRDSKEIGAGPVICFRRDQWSTFVSEAISGDIRKNGVVHLARDERTMSYDNGRRTELTRWHLRDLGTNAEIHFTDAEWAAFRLGCADGEFNFALLDGTLATVAMS
jgi:Domain of unknown function (DUF397)